MDTKFKKGQTPWNKKEPIRKVCPSCGKAFFVRPSWDRVTSCSRHCARIGKTTSDSQKLAASITAKKILPKFKKGSTPWNKGMVGFLSGEKHYNWKGGSSHGERVLFRDRLQNKIFRRDNYNCQVCGIHGVNLQVDHIKPWSKYPELRFEETNCRTLCTNCHYLLTFNKPMPTNVSSWGHNLKYAMARRTK